MSECQSRCIMLHAIFFSEVHEIEMKRDSVTIENEEVVTNYYRIRQQLDRLGSQLQVGYCNRDQ